MTAVPPSRVDAVRRPRGPRPALSAAVSAGLATVAVRPPHAPVELPPTAQMLVDGGDSRLALDPLRGTNKYGCRPFPDPELAAFGSSTASIISEPAFEAADQLRRRLLRAAAVEPAHVTYARELQRLRGELGRLCGLAAGSGVETVFAASGTDLHLIAAQLAAGEGGRLTAITVESSETGSGVPAALAGRHFSTSTALGQSVIDNVAILGADPVEVVAVPGREPDGALRPAADVAAAVAARAAAAIDAGSRVLLVLTDVSKTGMLSPGVEAALELRRRFAGALDILVDGCQFRLAPATVQGYLARGAMVAVTGSKFLTGPAFAGALFVPPAFADRFKDQDLAAGLGAYAARAEWPPSWAVADRLPELANYGLLLRWQAALTELAAFRALANDDVAGFIAEFGRVVHARLDSDRHFEAVPTPALARGDVSPAGSWDCLPTIFPFFLRRPGRCCGRAYVNRTETEQVYKLLSVDLAHRFGGAAALRCQVGQPVVCGRRHGDAVSALRLCLSARLIVRAIAGGGRAAVIAEALSVLDKAALIVDGL